VARSNAKISSETPATRPISRLPPAVVTLSAMSGAKRLCIERGVLSSLTRQRSFIEPTLAVVKIFSSFTQPVRPLSMPSVRKSDATSVPLHATRIAATNFRICMCLDLAAPIVGEVR
jgi:hypothetical protein